MNEVSSLGVEVGYGWESIDYRKVRSAGPGVTHRYLEKRIREKRDCFSVQVGIVSDKKSLFTRFDRSNQRLGKQIITRATFNARRMNGGVLFNLINLKGKANFGHIPNH